MTAKSVTMKSLLEAGVHFGHQKTPLEPEDEEVHLRRTQRHLHNRPSEDLECLDKATKAVKAAAAKARPSSSWGQEAGKDVIREEAKRCDMPFVTERWLGVC